MTDGHGAPARAADAGAWARRLAAELPEITRVDTTTRAAYSSDASIFRAVPLAVVEPRTEEDVARVVDMATDAGVPITARGGGTSIAGNALGSGVVLDFSTHMNRILDLDPEARTARVEPGVVLDDLRGYAGRYGVTFGPDPSTHSRCTLGGMIGNNSCGSHSVAWGKTADNVLASRYLLADGRRLATGRGGSADPEVDASLARLRDTHLAAFRTELDRFSRQVSGYGLHHLLPERGFDVARALVGSENTCGVLTEATVELVRVPAARALLVLGLPDVYLAAAVAPALARAGALTVEGMGADMLAALRARPGRSGAGAELPDGGGWLYCEVGAETSAEVRERAEELTAVARDLVPETRAKLVTDGATARALWWIREAGAGIVTRLPDGSEAWPGWEDSAVPATNLADYLRDLYALLRGHGLSGVPYGHFGEGCLHLRVDFDLGSERGLRAYRAFMVDAADLVVSHGGSIAGEHGDGRARSELLDRMYSPELIAAFAGFKGIFDPGGALNPGVMVDPAPLDADVRPGPGHDALSLTPVHALRHDGGSFSSAVKRCVGVGACRNRETGSMCPSFKATGDEVHSTRGRARVLAEMLRGESVTDGRRSTEVLDALDLCLSCKACARECPVNVDMATYKAEFLYHHYAGRPRPMAHYSMGWLPVWSRLVSGGRGVTRAANALLARPPVAGLVKRAAGIEPRREMVEFAPRSLRQWFRDRRGRDDGAARPTVVLWPDTFTNLHDPAVGRDATEVLEALGYRVVLPSGPVCCGLTWHSTGQLGMARRALRRTVAALEPQLLAGFPVVGLEPSCTVMLREEARELLPHVPLARRLAERVTTLAELVAAHEGDWPFERLDTRAVAQVHCHQEAKGSYEADRTVLERLGVAVDTIQTGCCGLAGNFGFEPGHWEVSQACAERELYPEVRAAAATDIILADGFSCRAQIAQGTRRRGTHLATTLRRALRS